MNTILKLQERPHIVSTLGTTYHPILAYSDEMC